MPYQSRGNSTQRLAVVLILIFFIVSLTGCGGVKQTSDKLLENKAQNQDSGGHTGEFLGSITDGKLVPIELPEGSAMLYCQWSPDGQWLAYSSDGDIFLYNGATGQHHNLTSTPDRWELMPSWSPDGSMLCFTSRPLYGREGQPSPTGHEVMAGAWGGCPTIINLDGTGYNILEAGLVTNPGWSADGKKVVYGCQGSIHLFNLEYRTARVITAKEIDLQSRYIGSPSWSPTRSEIAFFFYNDDRETTRQEAIEENVVNTEQGYALLDLQTSEVRILYAYESRYINRPPALWNADGSKLIFNMKPEGYVYSPEGIMLTNRQGGKVENIGTAYQVVWAPDGKQLAYMVASDYQVVKMVTFTKDTYNSQTIANKTGLIEGIAWRPAPKRQNE